MLECWNIGRTMEISPIILSFHYSIIPIFLLYMTLMLVIADLIHFKSFVRIQNNAGRNTL
jgi:hypothetical protein